MTTKFLLAQFEQKEFIKSYFESAKDEILEFLESIDDMLNGRVTKKFVANVILEYMREFGDLNRKVQYAALEGHLDTVNYSVTPAGRLPTTLEELTPEELVEFRDYMSTDSFRVENLTWEDVKYRGFDDLIKIGLKVYLEDDNGCCNSIACTCSSRTDKLFDEIEEQDLLCTI